MTTEDARRYAAWTMVALVLLPMPLYFIFVLLTFPFGGLLFLYNDSPWMLYLYPFLFTTKQHGSTAYQCFADRTGYLLTLAQWVFITWAFVGTVDSTWSRKAIRRCAAGLIALVGLVSLVLLNLFDLQVTWSVGKGMHM
jgi:hypothetical protein